MLANGKQFLLLIRHPPCYSYIQSSILRNKFICNMILTISSTGVSVACVGSYAFTQLNAKCLKFIANGKKVTNKSMIEIELN